MVKSHGRQGTPARRIELPDLTDFEGDLLEAGFDYEALAFTDRDFTAGDASDARFLECRMERCCVEGLSMSRTRVADCLFSEIYGASVDFADSVWRDSQMSGGRLGALTLPGATLTRVRLHRVKLGFVNLAAARLEDVAFEECEIGGIDARAAQLRSVSFVECTVQELNVTEATLSKVDLSGAKLRTLVGVDGLRGAIISHEQLLDLAPLLAGQLGIEVRPE
jgi:uncharacterized protein YjbI with pentapeptide repeats